MELRLKDYSQKIKGALPGDIVWIGNEPFIYLEEKEEELMKKIEYIYGFV